MRRKLNWRLIWSVVLLLFAAGIPLGMTFLDRVTPVAPLEFLAPPAPK